MLTPGPQFMRSISTTEVLNTGTWSILQPRFFNGVAPCMDSCPASTDMPRIYNLLSRGEVVEAAEVLLDSNPFPFVTSGLCPQFCKTSCNRKELDEAVEIRKIEAWLGEEILRREIMPSPTPPLEKTVLVVGSGPAGLSAAWYLAKSGVKVEIRERESLAGGMLAWGIPSFRFPREPLKKAIERLERIGVKIVTSSGVSPEELDNLGATYDAVVVATGLTKARRLPSVATGERVLPGLDLLKEHNLSHTLPQGKHVLVVGGGNVAVDVARVFARAGRKVTMACVESREEMPAIEEEVEEALAEGVNMLCSIGVREATGKKGQPVTVTLGKVRVVDHRSPLKEVEFMGQFQTGLFDLVVLAVGQEPEWQWKGKDRVLQAGDLHTGPSSVAAAIASGRETATRILTAFTGEEYRGYRESGWNRDQEDLVTFQDLNPINFLLFPGRNEVPSSIPQEVGRCLSCGYCNSCGICWLFCPDASIELQQPPNLDTDHCKGCGICATECPRGIVFMHRRLE